MRGLRLCFFMIKENNKFTIYLREEDPHYWEELFPFDENNTNSNFTLEKNLKSETVRPLVID